MLTLDLAMASAQVLSSAVSIYTNAGIEEGERYMSLVIPPNPEPAHPRRRLNWSWKAR